MATPPAATISSTTASAGRASSPPPSTATPGSFTKTRAPCRASSRQCARPMPRPPPVTMATRPSSITSARASREQIEDGAGVAAAKHVLRPLVEVPAPQLLGAVGVAGDDALEEQLVGPFTLLRALALAGLATPACHVGLAVQLDEVVEHLGEDRERLVPRVLHDQEVELLLEPDQRRGIVDVRARGGEVGLELVDGIGIVVLRETPHRRQLDRLARVVDVLERGSAELEHQPRVARGDVTIGCVD